MRLDTLTDSGRAPADPLKSAASVYALARLTSEPEDVEDEPLDPELADYLNGSPIFDENDRMRAGRFGE